MDDYYKILNIRKSASQSEIKKAYRQAALFWHPDKNKSYNAHENFILINEAYSILIDPQKRIVYDKLYDIYFTQKIDAVKFEKQYDYQVYAEWVKEVRTKAVRLSVKVVDDMLTDSFHFLDKYGMLIFIIIVGLFLLIISILMNK